MTLAADPTTLRGQLPLTLSINCEYELARNERTAHWDIRPFRYRYELGEVAGPELIAYHWHPIGQSHITIPHLHVGGHHPRIDPPKKHLPTGIVSFQDVLRCVITEFGVQPLRSDWQKILAATTDD